MGAVVIHDQLYVQIGRDGFVDGVEELAELNGPMAPMTFPITLTDSVSSAANRVVVP